MTSTSAQGKPPYFEFMERVAHEYELSGAVTSIENDIDGENIDVLVRHALPDGQQVCIAVECKYHARKIGIRDVERFSGAVDTLRRKGKVHSATMVSRVGFTPKAQACATSCSIHLITFENLSYKLTDFRRFVKESVDREDSVPHIGGDEFISLRGSLLNGEPVDDVVRHLVDWLHGEEVQLLMLGEGGSGKTTLCRKFALVTGKLFLEDKILRLPLYIDLRFGEQSGRISDIACRLLERQGIRITPAKIIELLKKGRICLILDGFDEFELGNIQRQVAREFSDLDEICNKPSKMLIACRTGFFRSKQDMYWYDLGTQKFRLAPQGRDDLVLNVDELEPRFIESQLRKHEGIRKLYHNRIPEWLIDLCKRPLHLKMVIRILESDINLEQLSATPSSPTLYDLYVTQSIEWDIKRTGVLIKDKHLRRFIYECLAVEMLNEATTCVSEELVRNSFRRAGIPQNTMESVEVLDILNSTLLSTSPIGTAWGHKTYGEYLGASYIMNLVRSDNRDFREMIWFTRDERAFIVDMLDEKTTSTLYSWLEGDDYEPKQFAAFIFGGTKETRVIEQLRKIADRTDDLLTRINCINTLGFLGQRDVVGDLLAIMCGYLRLKGLSYDMLPIKANHEFPVLDFVNLRNKIGLQAVTLHIREAADAVSRIGNSQIIPFLRCILMDDDQSLLAEVKEAIRRLEAITT